MVKPPVLPPICITVTGTTPNELLQNAQRALEHSRVVVLRLDWLPDPSQGIRVIRQLLESGPKRPDRAPLLQATCRRQQSGGRFRGTVAEQIKILQEASAAGCALVDIEIESAEKSSRESVESLGDRSLLVLSWHSFEETPYLEFVARLLQRFSADYYKVVSTAKRQSDNCVALEFLRSANNSWHKRWIVFCMGPAGIPSRALALSRGSAFIYAACPGSDGLAPSSSAAPGQIDYEKLSGVYRADKLTPVTAIFGLVGNPVGHSLGAAIHNAAMEAEGVDAVYLPLLSPDLDGFRDAANRYPLSGFSVTIPHKQNILSLLDRLDYDVRMAGAANTVRIRRGKWEAINSDVDGVEKPLRSAFQLSDRETLEDSFRAVVVGTGGAARAAFVALRKLECRKLFVAGRTPARAQRLAKDFDATVLPFSALKHDRFDLMINATPVGMWPKTEECLLTPEQINAHVVFDMVYNPAETTLLKTARKMGRKVISGLDMFLAQAARQFEYWTGLGAPTQLMRKVALRELARFPKSGADG